MKNLLVLSPIEIEFEADNRLYSLEITQQCLTNAFGFNSTESECPFTGVFSHDYTPVIDLYWWQRVELSTGDFWAVVEANRNAWYDVTECSDRGQALLKRQARASFLRSIMENANKLRKKLGNLGTALSCAWTKVKILASGVVNFIKLADHELENPPIQTRRVADGGSGRTGLLFVDLDKFEAAKESGMDEEKARLMSLISMHAYQVVNWGNIVSGV